MLLLVMLLGYFCLVGLAARRYGMRVQWLVLAGIIALVMIDLTRRSLP